MHEGIGKTIHSKYADGTPVYEGEQPPHLPVTDLGPGAPHTGMRWDNVHQRIYQGREYDAAGNPVRDIDFTSPTYPSGKPRPNHPAPPHEHRWEVNDPNIGPQSGFKREREGRPLK
jgi:hypothetical protein